MNSNRDAGSNPLFDVALAGLAIFGGYKMAKGFRKRKFIKDNKNPKPGEFYIKDPEKAWDEMNK